MPLFSLNNNSSSICEQYPRQTRTNTDMDQSTIKFRQALPYALFPASPALAALHAHRARLLHPDYAPPHPTSCLRCGSLLVQQPRSFVNKKSTRIHRSSCRICRGATDTPLPKAAFPPTRRHRTIPAQSPLTITQPIPSIPPPKSPPKPPSPVPSKSRPKKKSGLQNLLARNRENEEKERQKQKQNNTQLGGLAAFLSDL